ncbi:MAG: transporter substrate-binding domain-containing protein [Desulfobacteraceae bacterium]|nr:transporter substrate-binding domain-containing protein [Desulfobacteraceae bacterium]
MVRIYSIAVHRSLHPWRMLCILLAAWSVSAGTALAAERIVKVGIYENAPKIFTAEDGRPAGIFIDILEHIAAKEGWRLEYLPGNWPQGLERLEQGRIDLMPDVALTSERETLYDFHKVPVLSSWFQVYARKGSGIQSILDLQGKRVTVLEKSVQQEAFSHLAGGFGLEVTLIELPDYQSLFEKVARGEADAAITNRFYGAMHFRKYGLEDTAVIFHPTDLFFAVSKGGNQSLLDAIDAHLQSLKKDPQSVYYRSLQRWTAQEVRFQLPIWLKVAALTLAALLILSLMGSVLLKHQVNARTRQLRQINTEMEQRIAQRTEQLFHAMEKAQAADRIKTAFVASMSHELRTPLNSIIGFTGILLQGLAGALNDEQTKQMRMVQNSGRHLLSLINDVLDIAKIEAGQLAVASEPFDLSQTVIKVVESLSPQAEKNGARITLRMECRLDTLVGDRRRTEQILTNLIGNAIKFSPQGGEVTVQVQGPATGQTAAPAEAQTLDPAPDMVRVSVQDQGIGIKAEDIKTLFHPFRQIDTGITRKFEGTGLGLYISKRLVRMLGGEIEVQSAGIGQGSCFSFTLPLAGPPAPVEKPE